MPAGRLAKVGTAKVSEAKEACETAKIEVLRPLTMVSSSQTVRQTFHSLIEHARNSSNLLIVELFE